jgi:hypothetical protein
LALEEGKHCGQIDPFFLRLNREMVSCYLVDDVGTGGEVFLEALKSQWQELARDFLCINTCLNRFFGMGDPMSKKRIVTTGIPNSELEVPDQTGHSSLI